MSIVDPLPRYVLPATPGTTRFDGEWVSIVPRKPPGIVALSSGAFVAPVAGAAYFPMLEISEDGTKVRLRLERLPPTPDTP